MTERTVKKIPVNAIIAAIISVCLAIGVIIVGVISANNSSNQTANIKTSPSYNELYSTVKKLDNVVVDYDDNAEGFVTGTNTDIILDGSSSTTNNQVSGVDESDLVKNDGEYIYLLSNNAVKIVKANNGKPQLISELSVLNSDFESAAEIFVFENRLAVIIHSSEKGSNTSVRVYNTQNKSEPTLINTVTQNGNMVSARMIEDTIYLISNHTIYTDAAKKNSPETFVPTVDGTLVAEEDISVIGELSSPTYMVVSSININSATVMASEAVLGGAKTIYSSQNNLYYAFSKYTYDKNYTVIVKIGLSGKDISVLSSSMVEGALLNQFSMDEYNKNLRVVTTKYDRTATDNEQPSANIIESNALYVLDQNLNIIGEVSNLAKDEKVYSVRFSGDIGYFVTFRQVDPLFTVDLSNPEKPKVLNELKIPGFSEYLHEFGPDYLFGFGKSATDTGLVTGLKLSMFNVKDPKNVTEQKTKKIDAYWSEASGNHKAIMVDYDKNIIAFSVKGNYLGTNVLIYGFNEKRGFFERAELKLDQTKDNVRFLWIDKYFYIVSESEIYAYSIDFFAPTATLKF